MFGDDNARPVKSPPKPVRWRCRRCKRLVEESERAAHTMACWPELVETHFTKID